MERTLGIVKPDAFGAGRTGAIIDMIQEGGLSVRAVRTLRLSDAQARAFYAVHAERPFFGSLVEFMTSGPIAVMAIEGENAIARWREIMGSTDPAKAAAGTVRKIHGTDVQNNAVHGSDAPATAAVEVAFFFAGADLV